MPLAGPNDEDLIAWVFFADGRPVATLWNYTVHVNAHFGTSFSADYPGRVAAALREEFGADFFTLFLPGTCGDINHTVGFEQLHLRLSEAMREVVRRATPGDSDALGAAWREVRLGVRDREPFQESEISDKWPDCVDVFENEDRLLKANPRDDVVTAVQALRIGEGAVAATPGETFAGLGLDIKQRSPYALTAAVELCNDIVGYIPTLTAFGQGGVRNLPLALGEGRARVGGDPGGRTGGDARRGVKGALGTAQRLLSWLLHGNGLERRGQVGGRFAPHALYGGNGRWSAGSSGTEVRLMRSVLMGILAVTLQVGASADPIRVVDLSGGSPGLPLVEALAGLGKRVIMAPAKELPQLPPGSVLVLDGASDLRQLPGPEGWLEAFVSSGGGVLVAGLPDTLPQTAALWRALAAAAPAEAPAADLFPSDSGNWMWVGTQAGETADHIRYIRKSFSVAKPVKRAFVRCTADNLYWAYLNGEQVGYHWSWFDHELWDISARLRPGKNVLSFKARNVDGPGGFFGQIGIEYEDGTRELIVSDQTWKFHIPEEPNWTTVDFDDSSWRPATESQPMTKYTRISDRGQEVEGALTLHRPHPVLNAIADRFGTNHLLRGVVPRAAATVLASVNNHPVVLCSEHGQGRVVLIDAIRRSGGIGSSDMCDDLLATSLLWLGRRGEGLTVDTGGYPPTSLTRGAGVHLSYLLEGVRPLVDGTLTATLTHNGTARRVGEYPLRAGEPLKATWRSEPTREASADGPWRLEFTARDTRGETVFHRSVVCDVVNPLSLPSNRYVACRGMTLRFRGDLQKIVPAGGTLRAVVADPWGRELPVAEPTVAEGVHTWTYQVPDLAEGQYRLVVTLSAGGQVRDNFGVPFRVVPRLDLSNFFPTTMRLSPLQDLNKPAIEREIDDIRAHGFNTLTFSAHRLGAKPGSPYDYAEDYAQSKGMAVSYSFQGDFCLLQREGLPPVSVFSPEYREAIRPGIQAAVETCRQVPRLLNVQGYMDEPFQVSGDTFDTRPPAREEFKRRYGIEMPTREQAREDPALWLKYVDFWSDCFATGWRQSYAMVKELEPSFWVELTHDSHCTFGAAGRNFRSFWAVDDVFHWGAPFDSVNYDIYPYLSTDFRTGKFSEHRLPRMAGMHMAFAQMRNLAYTYGKKQGFWLESGWSTNLAPDAPGRQYPWSPRELTFTALAAGCDYLNTFWGIPEDPRWWEAYRGTMNEVKHLAPLLTRSRVPEARAAFLFPRTQHVLLQEEYWNVMVALEAFRQAYGELDCIHEEQLATGALKGREVLVLFDVHLLRRRDAEIIRDWVRAGGRLIADEVPSLDEGKHPLGVFESLFGVRGSAEVREEALDLPAGAGQLWGRRGYEAAGAKIVSAAGSQPLVLDNRPGAGRAVLLNFPLKDCVLDALVRGNPGGTADAIREMLREAATEGGRPGNVTSSNPGIEAALRQTPRGTTLLFLINHESRDEGTTVTLPRLSAGGSVRDLVSGAPVKAGPGYAMKLTCRWGETRVLGIFPSSPAGLKLAGLRPAYRAGGSVDYTLALGGKGLRGSYLLEVSVLGPDGRKYESFSALTCTDDAVCRRSVRLPANAQPGQWRIRAKSLWDGATATGSFAVR